MVETVNSPASVDGVPPVVLCVAEPELAVSLELTLRALGLAAHIHGVDRGPWALALDDDSILIIDRQLLPADVGRFFARLRARSWRGRAIVLSEDREAERRRLAKVEGVVLLEKPFVSRDLIALLEVD